MKVYLINKGFILRYEPKSYRKLEMPGPNPDLWYGIKLIIDASLKGGFEENFKLRKLSGKAP